MKLKLKKFVYLLNDVTNALLKKDRSKQEKNIKWLISALVAVSVILLLSLLFNLYLL